MKILSIIPIIFTTVFSASLNANERQRCGDSSTASFKADWIKVEPAQPMPYKNEDGHPTVISSNSTAVIVKIPKDEQRRVAGFGKSNAICVLAIWYGEALIKKELARIALPLSTNGVGDDLFLGIIFYENELDQAKIDLLRENKSKILLSAE